MEEGESNVPAAGATPPTPQLPHPAIEPLAYLLGKWAGEGEGDFPTINSFRYGEELTFTHTGKPAIAYTQKTWKLNSGEPMHAESGYWRPKPDGSIEVVISHINGLVEVQKGTYDANDKAINLKSSLVGNASKVNAITRDFKVINGNLTYVVKMSTNHSPNIQQHLSPKLDAPPLDRKSRSTGGSSSKRWRLSDFVVGRSKSDGKHKFFWLVPSPKTDKEGEKDKGDTKLTKGTMIVAEKTTMRKKKEKTTKESNMVAAHRLYYAKDGGASGSKPKSYLPYRKNLVGFQPF